MANEPAGHPASILNLAGKTAIITGAGQGIGRQAALHFAAHGAKVVINDYVEERAHAVTAEINALHGQIALGLQGDVTDITSVTAMAEKAKAHFGPVGILVNNAGNAGAGGVMMNPKPFWEQDPEDWKPWIGVNFFGVMNCCRVFLPDMVAANAGSVVTVISDAGRVGEADLEPYSAAKAGAAGFMRAIARKLGRHHVRANCVSIGTTITPTTAGIEDSENAKRALSRYVLRRFGTPDDVANMILFLASDASAWVTGQTYPVNGGYSFAT
jgi:3-oxoacyl-[acyl-carrier protein] reductase